MPAYLDRTRAESLLTEARLDALILLSPESFYYATGAQAGVATMWRKAGAIGVLIPAAAHAAEMAVVSDLFAPSFRRDSHIADVRESLIWVETSTIDFDGGTAAPAELIAESWRKAGRKGNFNRPETFDPSICYRHLADAISEQGLTGSRIGIEGDAISMADHAKLKSALPDVTLVDASELVACLKMVKSETELVHLHHAVTLAEHGIRAIETAIRIGITRNELAEVWQQAITMHGGNTNLSSSWEYISVGTDPWGGNAAVNVQDLIKVDVGCVVQGYTSDTGRTYVLGQATNLQRSLFDALMAGFIAGSALLKPGVKLCDVHAATLSAIRESGFPAYTRGHFGHGLGAGLGSEQWPFISAQSNAVLEPNMVIAFECPWYINGVGGMIIENQVLITEEGHQMMNHLPLDLCEIKN